MTKVHYTRDSKGHNLHITGHAGYSACGADVVCAGISAIGYALLGYLENCEEGDPDYAYMEESGALAIFSFPTERVDVAFEMALIGLMQIANQYPENVSIHISVIDGDSRE